MKWLMLKYTYKGRSLHTPVIKGQRSEATEAGKVERILQFSTVFDKEKYVLKC